MKAAAALVIWTALAVTSTLVGAASPAALAASAPPARERGVERNVAEDDNVRVEETRVRGESLRIVVKPKTGGGKEYEIVPATGAVDPPQPNNRRVGDRVWRLFSF